MWLQTSQKVGFLKMCSWKAWALLLPGCGPALVGVDVRLPGAGRGLAWGLPSAGASPCSLASLLLSWKKLSALLLRTLLVLKESDRLSFWSCNATTGQCSHQQPCRLVLGARAPPGTLCSHGHAQPPGGSCTPRVGVGVGGGGGVSALTELGSCHPTPCPA